jgi:hypothetical protein
MAMVCWDNRCPPLSVYSHAGRSPMQSYMSRARLAQAELVTSHETFQRTDFSCWKSWKLGRAEKHVWPPTRKAVVSASQRQHMLHKSPLSTQQTHWICQYDTAETASNVSGNTEIIVFLEHDTVQVSEAC